MDTLTAAQLAEQVAADVDDVCTVVEWIGDLHDDAIPPDWADIVRGVLDPGGERSRVFEVDLEESLRWAALDYLEHNDRAALRRISAAGDYPIAHALTMVAVIGRTPAGREWLERVDAWFELDARRPRFGINSPER